MPAHFKDGDEVKLSADDVRKTREEVGRLLEEVRGSKVDAVQIVAEM